MPLISVSAAVLVAHRRVRSPLVALGAAATVDLLVAYELVPRYGAIGAAAASVAALAVAASFQVMAVVHVVHTVDLYPRHMLSAALASGTATISGVAALYLLPGPFAIVVGTAVFMVVFAGVAGVLGIAASDDAQWLAELAGRAHPRVAQLVTRVVHP